MLMISFHWIDKEGPVMSASLRRISKEGPVILVNFTAALPVPSQAGGEAVPEKSHAPNRRLLSCC